MTTFTKITRMAANAPDLCDRWSMMASVKGEHAAGVARHGAVLDLGVRKIAEMCMHACGGCSQALVFVVPRDALKRLGLEVRPRCVGENARVFACMRAVAQKDARTQWS
jgi:hypothetical protein